MKVKDTIKAIVRLPRYIIFITVVLLIALVILLSTNVRNAVTVNAISPAASGSKTEHPPGGSQPLSEINNKWIAPDTNLIPKGKAGQMIRYGRELIAHTANYFGPMGSVAQLSNGMNCQNCHLDGGTRLFANNFAGVISSYPKMSVRAGKIQSATGRIAECFQRSMAGKVPDTAGKEVQAILAYMKWIGQRVAKGRQLYGSATEKLPLMDKAADPVKGKDVFVAKCQTCHGSDGQGVLATDKSAYTFPPLWGNHSYNDGAGMYRIINMAGFVKNNMPLGATYKNPQLTNEEAWNVAAFINSQARPHKNQYKDWADLTKKPIDFPFGPYADQFSEKQHKYGPFKPIKNAKTSIN